MKKEQKEQASKLKSERVYLDSNFFISAATDLAEEGEKARAVLKKITEGTYKPSTAALTIDEVLWIIQKEKDKTFAYESAQAILSIASLEIIAVDREIIRKSLEIYKNEGLRPRDAIHLAAMRTQKIAILMSMDTDFEKITDIQRRDFTK